MNATSSETGDKVSAPKSVGVAATVTPAAALGRHVEWLEFALAAARSEESWRVARLEKATKKSRDKRTSRLAEVREEIAELTALVAAIRGLQAGTGSRSSAAARPRATGPRKRSTTGAAKPRASSAPAVAAAASTAAPSTASTAKKPAPTRKRSTKAKPVTAATPRRRRASGPPSKGPA